MVKNKNSKFVFSTDPEYNKLQDDLSIPQNKTTSDFVYIERDRKQRRGKVVTVISKLPGNLKELQKELQRDCGAGGSLKNGNIEIQGDHRDKIAAILQKKGFKTKFKGG